MNDLQEVILDSLVAAEKIGTSWDPSPLRQAFEALRANGLTRRKDPGRALGYPWPLCEAIRGVCEGLTNTDKVRGLCVDLFRAIEPRAELQRLESQQVVEAAYWLLRYAHQLYNQREPLVEAVATEIERYLATGKVERTRVFEIGANLELRIERWNDRPDRFHVGRQALSAFFFALHTARKASELNGPDLPPGGEMIRPEDTLALGCLYTGRLAATSGGPGEGLRFCVELAQELGV